MLASFSPAQPQSRTQIVFAPRVSTLVLFIIIIYYDFTVHKTRGNMAIKYEIVTECTEGTPVGGAGALGMDRALQRTNNIK